MLLCRRLFDKQVHIKHSQTWKALKVQPACCCAADAQTKAAAWDNCVLCNMVLQWTSRLQRCFARLLPLKRQLVFCLPVQALTNYLYTGVSS